MKLNFWQILGLILLVIGAAMYVYKRSTTQGVANPNNPAPTSQTATH